METFESILKIFSLDIRDAWMILVSVVLFLVLWRVLDAVLFGPYLRLLAARDQATVGSVEDADAKLATAKKLTQQYEDRILAVRTEAVKVKLEKLAAARAEAQRIHDTAQQEAERKITEARRENQVQAERLLREGLQQSEDLVRMVVEKVAQVG